MLEQYQIYYRRPEQFSAQTWYKASHLVSKSEILNDFEKNSDRYEAGLRKATKITETPVTFVTEITIKETK